VRFLAIIAAALAAGLLVPPPRRTPPAERLDTRSASTADTDRGRLLMRVAVTVGGGLAATLLVGGGIGPPVGAVCAVAAWWLTGRMEPPAVRRRRERLVSAVPHVVDLMAACLAVGLSPAAAIEQISTAVDPPAADELAGLTARLRLGVDPVAVWRDLSRHPQLGGLGRSICRAVETGASVAEAMQRLADDLRRRSRAEVEARARAVGVKAAVPLGLCLLPAFVLVGVVPLVAGSVTALVGG
jgi:Flp pilus assembly protein TadB